MQPDRLPLGKRSKRKGNGCRVVVLIVTGSVFFVCLRQHMRTEFIGLFGLVAGIPLAGLALCALEVAPLPTPNTPVMVRQAVASARPNRLRRDGFHCPRCTGR